MWCCKSLHSYWDLSVLYGARRVVSFYSFCSVNTCNGGNMILFNATIKPQKGFSALLPLKTGIWKYFFDGGITDKAVTGLHK